MEAVGNGQNLHRSSGAIGRHKPTGLFRPKAPAVVDDFPEDLLRKEDLLPVSHQEAGTWQTHSEDPETVIMVGEEPQREQWGSLGTLSLRKVMERAS